MKIEQQVADTILQNSIGNFVVDGKEYQVQPPTTGTLIMISALISTLPEIKGVPNEKDFVAEILGMAKDCQALGQIAATLILGAKRIKEHPMVSVPSYTLKKKFNWKKLRREEAPHETSVPVFERDYLAEKILDNMTAKQLQGFINDILSEGELANFFVLTTSLREKSITSPTREVETMTASGDLSEAGPNIGS